MLTENVSTLKIHKLSQAQYDREQAAGRLEENAFYLTPGFDNSDFPVVEELPEVTEDSPDVVYLIDDETDRYSTSTGPSLAEYEIIPVVDVLPEVNETSPDVVFLKDEIPNITYADFVPAPAVAEVGQIMRVSEVNENGKPVAWEPYIEHSYELIDTITLEEDLSTLTLNQEPDGTPYKFKKLALGIRTTAADKNYSSNVRVFTDSSYELYAYAYNVYDTTGVIASLMFELQDKRRFSIKNFMAGIGAYYTYQSMDTVEGKIRGWEGIAPKDMSYIKQLRLDTDLRAGTTYEIYGVRV